MQLSLVIPCYNEGEGLPKLVSRCQEVIEKIDGEIILVNNGSTDNTSELLQTLTSDTPRIRIVDVEVNQGYGFGILSGLQAAKGDIIGWTHADMQTDPMDVIEGLKLFEKDDNPEQLFVKGRRYGRPLSDRVFTMGMSVFEILLLGHFLSDVNAQPTLFSRKFWDTLSNPPHDFSIDLFAYASAKKQKLRVRKFPVNFAVREHGESSWNINWAGKYKFIKRTLDYSFRLRQSFSNNSSKS